jgi:hypothetical protein
VRADLAQLEQHLAAELTQLRARNGALAVFASQLLADQAESLDGSVPPLRNRSAAHLLTAHGPAAVGSMNPQADGDAQGGGSALPVEEELRSCYTLLAHTRGLTLRTRGGNLAAVRELERARAHVLGAMLHGLWRGAAMKAIRQWQCACEHMRADAVGRAWALASGAMLLDRCVVSLMGRERVIGAFAAWRSTAAWTTRGARAAGAQSAASDQGRGADRLGGSGSSPTSGESSRAQHRAEAGRFAHVAQPRSGGNRLGAGLSVVVPDPRVD